MVLHSSEGGKVKCMILLDFTTTNNEVEYKTLIARLDLAKAVGAANMFIYCNKRMKKYLDQVKNRISDLQAKFVQIRREENK